MSLFPCDSRVDCSGSDFPLRNLSSEGPDLPQYSATGFCCNGQQAWAFSLVSQENADDALFRLLKTSCPECTEARQYCAEAKCPDGTVLAKYCSPISQEVVDEWARQREALMLPFCDDTGQLFSATCACPDGSNPITMFSPFSVDDALAACQSSRPECPPVGNDEQVCAARCPDGSLFYWVVAAGTILATTVAEANAIAYALACERAELFKVCISGPDPSACLNVAYSSVVTASTVTQITWQVLGSLPPGLTGAPVGLNGYRIQGIPTTAGIYPLTFVATNSVGNYAVKTVSIRVWGIQQTALPDGTFADLYSQQLTSIGGTAPYVYSLVSGFFPLGITMTSTGLISGIVGEEGVFTPEIRVIDHAGRICTQTFTLTCVSACPTPDAVNFTVPATPDKTFANATYTFENMAVIGASQKIATWGSDTNVGCLDIIDFSGVPGITNQFLMNAETGWQTRGAIYEPVSGLIVAVATKALTLDRISFFSPTTGYVDSIEISTTTDDTKHWEAVLMRGTSGQIAFYRGSFNAGDSAYIYVVDCLTKTVVRNFTLPSPAPNIYADRDFCYSCQRNEFFLTGSVALGKIRLYSINATTGVTRLNVGMPIIASTDYYCAYVDSTDKVILKSSLAYVYIFAASDGSVLTTQDLYYDSTYHALQLDNWIKYNFKLNSVMVSGIWYTDVGHTIIASGVLFINVNTLAITTACKTLAGSEFDTPYGAYAESNGDVYMQCNDGASYPFKQIRATII